MRAVAWVLAAGLTAGCGAAMVGPGEPVDVVQELGGGATMNWTALDIEVRASSTQYGVGATQAATEQRARQQVGPALRDHVARIRVTSADTLGQLQDQGAFGGALTDRVRLWSVGEATYTASGRVDLLAQLPLDELLRPWTLQRARTVPPRPVATDYTGLVVDARAVGVAPAFAPRLLAPDGQVLYDGFLWRERALERAPVVWVSDLAHPESSRAGFDPLFVEAVSARGSDLVIDAADAAVVEASLVDALPLGFGTVVVLVEP